MRLLVAGTAVWLATVAIVSSQQRTPFAGLLDQHPAIDYRGGALTDVVSVLQADIKAGAKTIAFDGQLGYLRSVLAALNVPVESQVLLFSKTGLQHPFTSPENPRALYFNDRVVVGYIPGAPVLEIASHDPRQGVIFQTLKQDAAAAQFARPDRCLGCHLSSNSMSVPGILVRSMSTAPDGRPMPQDGSFVIDHRSRLEQRWAGWFVTGASPSVTHLGRPIDGRVDLSAYPQRTSDVAALLAFDHQGHAINLLTRLGWEARFAAAEGRVDFTSGDLGDILKEAVDYFLFVDETPLASPVQGTSEFARNFSGSGPRDKKGRSLRDLDLQTRLLKYRCSYMIYSPAFDGLPAAARAAFFARARTVLQSRADTAVMEILDDTRPGWR
jgi:hypothetical protein